MQVAPFFVSSAGLNQAVNSNETLVQTLPPFEVPRDACIALVTITMIGTSGNTATAFRIRGYRGATITGPLVLDSGAITYAGTSGTPFAWTYTFVDTLALAATVQYTASLAVTGNSSFWTVTNCTISGLMMF